MFPLIVQATSVSVAVSPLFTPAPSPPAELPLIVQSESVAVP